MRTTGDGEEEVSAGGHRHQALTGQVMTSEGKSIAPVVKVIGVTETTFFSSGQTNQAASSPRISVST